MVSLLIG